ncbi:hypothetical protein DBR43_09725 [Pedobacter sp. KBW06]|uniref:hypothetical protein n=1 Tax=Pedobacter sp. KBW06 TaxID=2153359 RepID=UPI000F5B30B7|nr:hypothetical protein [Pedobacter sp. KBW06]RQO75606.1 hypothetical protein DBR43_09725 [Pedobacter sp. KBW06]
MNHLLKLKVFFCLWSAVWPMACQTDIIPGIAGTYVDCRATKMGFIADTFKVVHDHRLRYKIYHNTGFKFNDETAKTKHKSEFWSGEYDDLHNSISECRHGNTIFFNTAKGTLTVREQKYERLK